MPRYRVIGGLCYEGMMQRVMIFFLLANGSVLGMQTSLTISINAPNWAVDSRERNLLHYLPGLPFKDVLNISLAEEDEKKACLAVLILEQTDIQVDAKDKDDQTPYDLAKAYKKQLPKLFQVIKAGKITQDIRRRISENPRIVLSDKERTQWHAAELLLAHYN